MNVLKYNFWDRTYLARRNRLSFWFGVFYYPETHRIGISLLGFFFIVSR